MNNTQTANIIKAELKKNSKTITNMITDLNLSKSFMQNLIQRGSKPSIETMENIAKYLGVSIDYLVGREKVSVNTATNSNIANTGGNNTINIHKNEDVSGLELEILQEVKKLTKPKQIELLSKLLEDNFK